MKAATLFSGIGAPEYAALWLDWRWCAEIDPFASAVHAARFPGVPNFGDVNAIRSEAVEPVNLVIFGSPCQSFSVAGKRLGLDDPRGNLALVALRLVSLIRPRWLVFENVPGLLSSDGGRDFGAFLGLLGECGYGFAYRVLDAQHFGVPQRRRRVFVVGHPGDWRPAAAVLFEPESLRGDPAPRREAGQGIARPVASSPEGGSGYRNDADTADNLIAFDARNGTLDGDTTIPVQAGGDCKRGYSLNTIPLAFGGNRQSGALDVATAVRAKGGTGHGDFESETFILADGFDASEDGTGRGTPIIPIQNSQRGQDQNGLGVGGESMFTLDGASQHAVAFESRYARNGRGAPEEVVPPLKAQSGQSGKGDAAPLLQAGMSVRRLTPVECERLQGFPDNWTAITWRGKPAADGPRYRALGNSMAVPVVRWILWRIEELS